MDNFRDIMSGILFYQLFSYAIIIAVSLLQINGVLENPDEINADIIMALNGVMLQSIFNFVLCKYADSVTEASFAVTFLFYQLEWYRFGVKEQKLLRQSIQRAQQIFGFKGNGIIDCSQETFLAVWRVLFESTLNFVFCI